MSATLEQQIEALLRAKSGFSKNDAIVYIMLTEAGFEDVRPRENVFTFNAWKAQGRVVKKGEKGFAITTWIPCKPSKKQTAEGEDGKKLRPKTAYVFHISQTIEAGEPQPAAPTEPAEEIIDVEFTVIPAIEQRRLPAPRATQLCLF